MADGVLLVRRHLAEGFRTTVRLEHRIIAKTVGATDRPDQDAMNSALEGLHMAVGPSQRQGTDELSLAVRIVADLLVDLVMAWPKSLLGPAQRAE